MNGNFCLEQWQSFLGINKRCFLGSTVNTRRIPVPSISSRGSNKFEKGGFNMKAVVTRVSEASVQIEGAVKGEIGKGFLILLGVAPEDNMALCHKLADKICHLRVFQDENDKMNFSLDRVGGEILVISQFTLFADTKSRRPGFTGAGKPDIAIPLYEGFVARCKENGFHVETGTFGADMKVSSLNDGPVTILFDET